MGVDYASDPSPTFKGLNAGTISAYARKLLDHNEHAPSRRLKDSCSLNEHQRLDHTGWLVLSPTERQAEPDPHGSDPTGPCDCSSLMQRAYGVADIKITRTTYTQIHDGRASRRAPSPSNLATWSSPRAPRPGQNTWHGDWRRTPHAHAEAWPHGRGREGSHARDHPRCAADRITRRLADANWRSLKGFPLTSLVNYPRSSRRCCSGPTPAHRTAVRVRTTRVSPPRSPERATGLPTAYAPTPSTPRPDCGPPTVTWVRSAPMVLPARNSAGRHVDARPYPEGRSR